MAFTYKLQAPDGQVITFNSEQQLTQSQAQQAAASIYDQRIAAQAQLEQTAGGTRNPLEFLADTALGLGKGVLGLGATASDIATLFGSDEVAPQFSDMFRSGQEALGELKSDEAQAREKLFQQEMAAVEGQGFGTELTTAVGHLVTNPSLLLDMAVEQIPQLLPIAKAGQGARALMAAALPEATAKTLSRAGIGGAAVAAGSMQGSDIGMQTYDRVYAEYKNRGASDEEAAIVAIDEARKDALQAGLVTLGTTALIPGAASVERALIGGATTAKEAVKELGKYARTRAATRGMLGEAVQEGAEEGGGAYISNLSAIEAGADIDPLSGVGSQAGVGAALGGVFGLPAGIVQGGRDVRNAAQQSLLEQAQADAKAKRERGTQLSLPGIPEVAGPPVPTQEQLDQQIGFQLEQEDMNAPEQLGLDLQPQEEPAPKPSETGQLSLDLDMRSDEEQLAGLQDQLKNFNEYYPKDQFTPRERGQIRRGIEQRAADLNKRILATNSETLQAREEEARRQKRAEESPFATEQPDLFGEFTAPKEEAPAPQREVVPEQGELFGGPQQELDLGPQAIDRAELERGGLPARQTKVYSGYEQRLAGLFLGRAQDREQIQQIADELGNMKPKWAGNLSAFLNSRLQETEELAATDPTQLAREKEQADMERDVATQVREAVAAGIAAQDAAKYNVQRDIQTKVEDVQRERALADLDRQAEETKAAQMEEAWATEARTNKEAELRKDADLGAMEQEAANRELALFDLDLQVVDDTFKPDQKPAAIAALDAYNRAVGRGDKKAANAIDNQAKQRFGNLWSTAKRESTLEKTRQRKSLEAEVAGDTKKAAKLARPDLTAKERKADGFQMDLFAEPQREDIARAQEEEARLEAIRKADEQAVAEARAKFKAAIDKSKKTNGAVKVASGNYVYRGYQIEKDADGVWNVGKISKNQPVSEFDDAADTLNDAKAIVDNYIEPEVTQDAEQPAVRETEVRGRVRRDDQQPAGERRVDVAEPAQEQLPATTQPTAPEPRGVGDTGTTAGRGVGRTGGEPATLTGPVADMIDMMAKLATDNTYENAVDFVELARKQKLISNAEAETFGKNIRVGKRSRQGVVTAVAKRMGDNGYFTADTQIGKAVDKANASDAKKAARQAELEAKANARMEREVAQATKREQDDDLFSMLDDDMPLKRGVFEDNKFSTVEELKQAVGKLVKRLSGTIDVKLVQSRSDLPAEINAPAGTKGVYHNGVAYIIADNVPTAEAETVIAHETVGHAGLETILGKEGFSNLLKNINAIKESNPRIKGVLENIKRMYTDPQGNYNLSPREEAMEILAHIAEAKTEYLTDNTIRRVWNTAVQMFRRAMSRLGFIDPADITIDQLIHEAALHMQGGKHINRDRYFLRHDYMAAHTMQRAWDMGFRGFDLDAAGAHIKGVANGSIQVPQITEDVMFGQDIDHDFINQAVFSRGEAAQPEVELDADTKNIIATRGRPQAAPKGMAASLREIIRDRGAVNAARRGVDYIRVMMFDSAATLEDKLMKSYNNAMAKDGFINPMVPYVQALRAEGMAMQVLRTGSLRVDENGLWEATKVNGVSSMHDVFNELEALGKQIGPDAAQDLFHAVTIAQRELEIERQNRENQAEADRIREAGGKNAAANAKKLEDKIVNLHPGKDEAWQSERDAQNRDIVRKFDQYPELRRAHDHFLSTKNSLVDTLVGVGFFTKEKGEDLKQAIGYVPFNRLLEDGESGGYDAHSTGLMRIGSLGTLNGSMLEVDNILDNMIKKVVWMTQTAMRVRAANELVRGLSDEGVDGIQGFYDTQEQVPEAEKAGLITYYKDGKMKYATTKDKLDAFAFRGNEAISLPLLRLLANATDWLRKGITLSPEFIIGQWQQDSMRAYAMGGTKNGLKTAAKVTASYAKIRKSLAKGEFGDENLNKYGIQGMYDATSEHNRDLIDAQIDPTKKTSWFKKAIDFGEHNAEASDLAQRKAIYDQTLLETNDPVLAFWRASEVINFNRRGAGKTASVLRQLVPFMNAYFQGMNVLGKAMLNRGLQQDQKSAIMPLFWSGMTKLFVLNMMYAMAMADDDDYQNQPDYIRSRYLALPIGDGMNVKWAMPADLAFFFKAIPEAIAMGVGNEADSKKIANFLGHSMWEAMAGPSALPQFGKPVIEAATNHSFFTDAPIVSQGFLNRKVEDRYTESTSQFARMLGKSGIISPLIADHLIKGFTGTLGGTALTLGDLAAEAAFDIERTDRELADLPVARAIFTRTAPTGFKQDFYALRKDMREVYGSYKAALSRGDFETAMEIYQDDPKLIQLRKQINAVDKVIKDSNARIKKIQAGNLSGEEKRRRIDIERERQSRLTAQINRMRRFAYD